MGDDAVRCAGTRGTAHHPLIALGDATPARSPLSASSRVRIVSSSTAAEHVIDSRDGRPTFQPTHATDRLHRVLAWFATYGGVSVG